MLRNVGEHALVFADACRIPDPIIRTHIKIYRGTQAQMTMEHRSSETENTSRRR